MTPLFDLDSHTVFLGITGSHAYGMARPTSDVDIRGACIPPRHIRASLYRSFEQFVTTKQPGSWGPNSRRALEQLRSHESGGPCYANSDGMLDVCVYSLSKLMALAAVNNPNILELLFLDDRDVLYSHKAWEYLLEHRTLFLSKKVRHTYTGYAMSQLKRIKGHRSWLLSPPAAPPTRAEFGLPEESVLPANVRNQIDEAVVKTIRQWGVEEGLDEYITGAALDSLRERMAAFQASVLGCSDSLLEEKVYDLAVVSMGLSKDILYAIKQERKYRSARAQWQQFERWKSERNPDRACLEASHGYDTKHASHLIRLLRTGAEILEGKGLLVRRPDAQELKEIRDGLWDYDELLEQAQKLQERMREAAETSPLPESVDLERIDEIHITALELL